MKKTLAIATLLLTNSVLIAQEQLEKTGKVSLGLQGIELSYEHPFAKTFIWESSLGAGVGMNATKNDTEYIFNIPHIAPFIATGAKWMYNFDKRVAEEKDTKNNAANYLGLQTKFSFGNEGAINFQNQALLTDIHWGLQRNLGSKFTINANIGLGYMYDFENTAGNIAPTLRLKFGYRIF